METTHFDKVWNEFATEAVNASRRELGIKRIGKNKNYGVATRTLQRNLKVTIDGQTLDFSANPPADRYADFINAGVNGTKLNRGSIYSYRDKMPPVAEIRKWMKVKPVRLRDQKTGEFIRQTESKLNAAAYNIARGIQKNGIAGLNYFEKGVETAYRKFRDRLWDAYNLDIADELERTLNNGK